MPDCIHHCQRSNATLTATDTNSDIDSSSCLEDDVSSDYDDSLNCRHAEFDPDDTCWSSSFSSTSSFYAHSDVSVSFASSTDIAFGEDVLITKSDAILGLKSKQDRFWPTVSGMRRKTASESNIEDALIMMEPGLRKITRDKDFTSEEESWTWSSDFDDQLALEDCNSMEPAMPGPDSGFYCYTNDYDGDEDLLLKHVSVISVRGASEQFSINTPGLTVTVNGRLFYNFY